MRKKIELGTAIFFIITAILISSIVTYMYLAHMAERATGKSELFEKISQVHYAVNTRYIGEIDEDAAMNALLSGYIDGIDKYGVYLNKSDYLEVNQSAEGKTSGIGATVRYVQASGSVKVERVRAGSPCDEAGVLAGDQIVAINGEDVAAIGYTAAAERLKATVGSEIKLSLLRDDKTLEISVTVEEYILETVTHQIIGDDTAVVAISEFDNNTAEDFIALMDSLKDKGISKFVFDVRNNPGGSLGAVVEVLDYILPEGTLCTTKDKTGEVETFTSDANALDGKIAVLINNTSYSGAELFAAAIRDFKAGTLVGVTTYGKGMAQDIIPLGDDTALYLSTNYYYPPNGKNYEGIGVSPDKEVALTADLENRFYELTYSEDVQLQAAVEAVQ